MVSIGGGGGNDGNDFSIGRPKKRRMNEGFDEDEVKTLDTIPSKDMLPYLPAHIQLEILTYLDHQSLHYMALMSIQFAKFIHNYHAQLNKKQIDCLEFAYQGKESTTNPSEWIIRLGELKEYEASDDSVFDVETLPCKIMPMGMHAIDYDEDKLIRCLQHFEFRRILVNGGFIRPATDSYQDLLRFVQRFLSEDLGRAALIERFIVRQCVFEAVALEFWLEFLTKLSECVADMDSFDMYTCYAPTIDYYVPAMLASGLIYKVRGVEEMENYDVLPTSDETSLRRDHHAGFLRNFLVTKVDEYDWYRMDYAEDEWAYIYIIIYADDLSAEHLVQMLEAWHTSPMPICKRPRILKYQFRSRGIMAAIFAELKAAGFPKAIDEVFGKEYVLVKHPKSPLHFIGIVAYAAAPGSKEYEECDQLVIVRGHRSVDHNIGILFADIP